MIEETEKRLCGLRNPGDTLNPNSPKPLSAQTGKRLGNQTGQLREGRFMETGCRRVALRAVNADERTRTFTGCYPH